MAIGHVGKQTDREFERHDCGEVYASGTDMPAPVNNGHYGGPLIDCALPFANPIHQG